MPEANEFVVRQTSTTRSAPSPTYSRTHEGRSATTCPHLTHESQGGRRSRPRTTSTRWGIWSRAQCRSSSERRRSFGVRSDQDAPGDVRLQRETTPRPHWRRGHGVGAVGDCLSPRRITLVALILSPIRPATSRLTGDLIARTGLPAGTLLQFLLMAPVSEPSARSLRSSCRLQLSAVISGDGVSHAAEMRCTSAPVQTLGDIEPEGDEQNAPDE